MTNESGGFSLRNRLLECILTRCSLEQEQLELSCRIAEKKQKRIELVLRERELVSDEQLALATADYLELPPIRLAHFTPDEQLLRQVPARVKLDLGVLPLARWDSVMAVAMLDPFDLDAVDQARELTGCEIVSYVAPENEVRQLLQEINRSAKGGLEDVLRDVSDEEPEYESDVDQKDDLNVEELFDLSEEEPVVRIVNSILLEALQKGASDIHIEPMPDAVYVRYRIDGVLYDRPSPPKHLQWPIISRLKIIANLDIAERRLSQDGRFSIRAFGRDADVRMSVMPTVDG